MTAPRLGIFGLALGHPLSFSAILAEQGMVPSCLVFDANQPEEVDRAAQLRQRFPSLAVAADAREMLSRGVDAVICSSQAHRHLTDIAPLLEARVPLFVDKPLAPDYDQARRILDLAAQHDAPFFSCSARRFSGNYNALFDTIRAGKIGPLLWVECFEPHGTRPGYWQDVKRRSGGLAVNYGVHVVDPIVRALGATPRAVHAFAARRVLTEVDSEDTAVISIQFADGVIALGKVGGGYHFGCGKPVPTVGHFVAHGADGALETFIDETDVKVYRGGNFGVDETAYHYKGGYQGLLAAFQTMIRTGQRPVSFSVMDAAMRILDAARRSIDTGTVIALA